MTVTVQVRWLAFVGARLRGNTRAKITLDMGVHILSAPNYFVWKCACDKISMSKNVVVIKCCQKYDSAGVGWHMLVPGYAETPE